MPLPHPPQKKNKTTDNEAGGDQHIPNVLHDGYDKGDIVANAMAGVHPVGADAKEDSSATAADATADVNLKGASDRATGDQAKGSADRKSYAEDDAQVTPGVKKS